MGCIAANRHYWNKHLGSLGCQNDWSPKGSGFLIGRHGALGMVCGMVVPFDYRLSALPAQATQIQVIESK